MFFVPLSSFNTLLSVLKHTTKFLSNQFGERGIGQLSFKNTRVQDSENTRFFIYI